MRAFYFRSKGLFSFLLFVFSFVKASIPCVINDLAESIELNFQAQLKSSISYLRSLGFYLLVLLKIANLPFDKCSPMKVLYCCGYSSFLDIFSRRNFI